MAVKAEAKPAKNAKTAAAAEDGVTAAPTLRKKEFLTRVARRAGSKPNQVRAATEAALAELGAALLAGETVNLPGVGKVTVRKRTEKNGATHIVCKLRLPASSEALAEG